MKWQHWCGVLAGAALFSLALCNPIWAQVEPRCIPAPHEECA